LFSLSVILYPRDVEDSQYKGYSEYACKLHCDEEEDVADCSVFDITREYSSEGTYS